MAQNTATLNQFGAEQTARQTQTGDQQVSIITQRQAEGMNAGNQAATHQTGTLLNTAIIQQNNGSQHNRASGPQTGGTDNYAFIYQGDTFAFSGGSGPVSGNTTTLTQRGNGNTAELWTMGNRNTLTVEQTGDANCIRGIVGGQFGVDHVGKQLGDDNTLTSSQTSSAGGAGHMAKVQQMGLFNASTIQQTAY